MILLRILGLTVPALAVTSDRIGTLSRMQISLPIIPSPLLLSAVVHITGRILPPVLFVEEDLDDLYLIQQRLDSAGAKNPIVSARDVPDAIAFLEGVVSNTGLYPIPSVMFTDLKLSG